VTFLLVVAGQKKGELEGGEFPVGMWENTWMFGE
jgi:hypothetical protein